MYIDNQKKNKITESNKFNKFINKVENFHTSFDYIKITLASPLRIKSWAERKLPNGKIIGEVLIPETFSNNKLEPQTDGLLCEKIFGPLVSWKCKCGKYKGYLFNKICEDCNVEIIDTQVRRYRMGYINLNSPVVHSWYLNSKSNYLHTLLSLYNKNIKVSNLQELIYFRNNTKFIKQLLLFNNILNFQELIKKNELNIFLKKKNTKPKILKGSELLKTILENINIKKEINILRTEINKTTLTLMNHNYSINLKLNSLLFKRLRLLESFDSTKTNPGWIILTVLPILPPSLRPIYELENNKIMLNDINELYKKIISTNRDLLNTNYNDVSLSFQKRLLQEQIDLLIDKKNSYTAKSFLNKKPIKSLTEILKGKYGRFRQSLLGKRVDYSARSIITVGPDLRLNQCGLPYEMVKELFKPYLISELLKISAFEHLNIKVIVSFIDTNKPLIWILLNKLFQTQTILLNRAPTLHRFGIQAFNPILTLGKTIVLHPLVCNGFNADFDGDQMAVHVPLYEISQLEISTMMRPSDNIMSPANGELILKPTQDMVIGCYYLTIMLNKKNNNIKKWYPTETEALIAFSLKQITLHTPILIRYKINPLKFTIINNLINLDLKNLGSFEKKIILYKKFKSFKNIFKYYLITNIGIFIVNKLKNNNYVLTNIFLETTPGRLIFNLNFKNNLNKE